MESEQMQEESNIQQAQQEPAVGVELPSDENDKPNVESEGVSGKKKNKKKEDRGVDQLLKSLQIHDNNVDKLQVLCKKYSELAEEHKTLQSTFKVTQRTLTQISREKDQLQSEHSKTVLTKSRLESLCRELQKQNKFIKEESINRVKEDEDKRKEIHSKFQTTINEIQQQMNEHYQKNTTLREENQELANKLKELYEKYEVREQHIDNVIKTREIESQLYDAKIQQANLHLTEEKEIFLQEKQKMLQESVENQKKIALYEEQEKHLKSQIAVYTERYEEFQKTLSKSNDVFNTFKSEMEKMSKKIKKLERETSMWRQKYETSNKTLVVMAEEKLLHQKETTLLQAKVARLEGLCRAMQEERKKYLHQEDGKNEKNEGVNGSADDDEHKEGRHDGLEVTADDDKHAVACSSEETNNVQDISSTAATLSASSIDTDNQQSEMADVNDDIDEYNGENDVDDRGDVNNNADKICFEQGDAIKSDIENVIGAAADTANKTDVADDNCCSQHH